MMHKLILQYFPANNFYISFTPTFIVHLEINKDKVTYLLSILYGCYTTLLCRLSYVVDANTFFILYWKNLVVIFRLHKLSLLLVRKQYILVKWVFVHCIFHDKIVIMQIWIIKMICMYCSRHLRCLYLKTFWYNFKFIGLRQCIFSQI